MTAVPADTEQPTRRTNLFSRPTAQTGWKSWLTTTDHKKIGIMYWVAAMFFFVVAGLEALLLRIQLAVPNNNFLSPDVYNQLFTMHGITMVFFVGIPIGAAFFNYVMPLQIGARDVAFPRMNGFSFWVFCAAGIFMYSGILLGGLPDGGWFNYAPLSTGVGPDVQGYTVAGGGAAASATAAAQVHLERMLLYSIGLQIAGIASLASAVNYIVTILNMRAPGMTLMRMPVFTWMTLVVAFLLLFAMPVIGIALWQLMFEIRFGANFFNPSAGGDPVLWQHMFWLFGHPEVYILILPAFGMISDIIPTFSRKPIFGYTALVFAGIAIGFLGWGVWAHHMFTTGMGPVANTAFSLTTMFIAVPTGVKIFNWIGTMWGGKLRFTTPMLFAVGAVAMFTIGGLSGVTHSVAPHNYQQTDSYYVVAHFHYVLFGGLVFGALAGTTYWYPKATGRMLNERLGKLSFWTLLVGFNVTFGLMHFLGLWGMPRRIDTYASGFGWDTLNLLITFGAFLIAIAIAMLVANVVISLYRGPEAGDDPWDARTLEWMTSSPPPHYNFAEIPQVSARDELWHRKHAVTEDGQFVRVPSGGSVDVVDDHDDDHPDIHMPDPSYWPLISAVGMPIMGWALFASGATMIVTLAVGTIITVGALFAWAFEPMTEEAH
jgi:cytochrome c oxidase subunit 1